MKLQIKNVVILSFVGLSSFSVAAFSLDEIKGQITAADTQLKNAYTQMSSGKTLLVTDVPGQLRGGVREIEKTLGQVKGIRDQIGSIRNTIDGFPNTLGLRKVIFGIVQLSDLEKVVNLLYSTLDDMVKYLEHMRSNFNNAITLVNKPQFQDIDPRPEQNATPGLKNIATKFDIAQFKLKKATDMLDSILDRMNKNAADLD